MCLVLVEIFWVKKIAILRQASVLDKTAHALNANHKANNERFLKNNTLYITLKDMESVFDFLQLLL